MDRYIPVFLVLEVRFQNKEYRNVSIHGLSCPVLLSEYVGHVSQIGDPIGHIPVLSLTIAAFGAAVIIPLTLPLLVAHCLVGEAGETAAVNVTNAWTAYTGETAAAARRRRRRGRWWRTRPVVP
jgi:hypothetical protein